MGTHAISNEKGPFGFRPLLLEWFPFRIFAIEIMIGALCDLALYPSFLKTPAKNVSLPLLGTAINQWIHTPSTNLALSTPFLNMNRSYKKVEFEFAKCKEFLSIIFGRFLIIFHQMVQAIYGCQ